MDKVKIYINGKEHEAEKGMTVLQVCRNNGYDIPTLCFHEQLEPFGSCFLCTVEIEGGKKKYSLSCGTTVTEGMKIKTDTNEIWKQRKMALELLMSNHYADCVGPCLVTCPSNIDIQGYIAAIAEGDYTKAISIIKNDNPFPAVCGRVCTRPCEDECRRNLVDSKVGIDYLKRYAADKDIASKHMYTASAKKSNGKRIAIIGAGPSGLSAAYYLALEGYKVEVFEQFTKPGGMLRYGIPKYRLPHDVLDTEIESIRSLGVEIHTGKKLGMDFSLDDIKAKKFDAIYLAIGAHECMFMGIEGEDAEGVFGGIGFLRDTVEGKKIDLGKNVIVIGGGNTAIDAARVSVRSGAENVTMVYRRTVKEMPAHESEIEDAVAEGIKIAFLTNPTKVIKDASGHVTKLECVKMELGEPDASGRRSPRAVKGSEFTIDADTVIFAIGQKSELKCVEAKPGTTTENLKFTKWQTISANEKNFQTDEPGVFAGGDFRRGPDTVIGSIADGKKAAWVMNKYITTGEIVDYPEEFFSRRDNLIKQASEMYTQHEKIEKVEMPKIDALKRKGSYEEVETGFTDAMAVQEAGRCLECGCKSVFDCELKDSSNAYSVKQDAYKGALVDKEPDKRHPYIIFEPNKCINCGRCIRMCGEVVGLSVLGFVNRGFETLIRPPFDKSLQETDCISCGLCADACPTGAIIIKTDTLKGPMQFSSKESACTYCSFGCELKCDVMGDKVVAITGKEDSKINEFGNICKFARFGFREINRKDEPKTTLEDAVKSLKKLKEKLDSHKGEETAFYIGENTSLEEAFLIKKISENYKSSFVGSVKDYRFNALSDASLESLRRADSIFVIGADPYDDFPMVMPEIMKAKKKDARLSYIGIKDRRIKRNADACAQFESYAEIDEFLSCMTTYLIKEKGLKSSEKEFEKLVKKAGECKGKCCSGSEFAEELFKSENPIVITSGNSLVNGVFASINNMLTLLNKDESLLIFGESANSAGFTLMGLNKKHTNGAPKNAVYYNSSLESAGKDAFVFGWRKNNGENSIRINHPFSQSATYLNAFNTVVNTEKVVNCLDYSNVELLILLLNMVTGGKYSTSDFEKEFKDEMKKMTARIKEMKRGGFLFADSVSERILKTDGFRDAGDSLLK